MSAPLPSTRSRVAPCRLLAAPALVALVLLGAGCADGNDEQGTRRATQPAASVLDHREVRQTGETVLVAAQLVPVPGYEYKNVGLAERALAEEQVRKEEEAAGAQTGEMFSSLSFHGVVADDKSQNTANGSGGPEVGFLQLYELTDLPPAGLDQQLGASFTGKPVIGSFEVAGTKVWVAQDDSRPDSKYVYVWVRDGVLAVFDGATRPETEQWVRAYLALPALEPGETGTLSAALRPTPGYVFGNYLDPLVRRDWVTTPFGKGVDYSLHQVADQTHTVGGLNLVDTGDDATAAEQAQKVADSFEGATVGEATTVAGTQVVPVSTDQMEAFVWVKDGVTGTYLTDSPATAPPFLAAFLGAPSG